MQASRFEHALPLDDDAFENLVRGWMKSGLIVVSGPKGSGRRSLVRALSARLPASSQQRTAVLGQRRNLADGWVLKELGLIEQDAALFYTTEGLARHIADQHAGMFLVVEGSEQADQLSLRVLAALKRYTPKLPTILIENSETVTRATDIGRGVRLLRIDLPAMRGDALKTAAHRLVGATPTGRDVPLLEQLSGGGFRNLCWLLDFAGCNGALFIDSGWFHLDLPSAPGARLPVWSPEPDIQSNPGAQALALAGALPLPTLEDLGLLPEIVDLEASGHVSTSAGTARLSSRALQWDVSLRQPEAARHLLLARIAAVRGAQTENLVEFAAWMLHAGAAMPDPLRRAASSAAARAGEHGLALDLASAGVHEGDPDGPPDVLYSSIVCDDEATAEHVLMALPLTEPVITEAAAISLLLGLFRCPESRIYAAGFARARAALESRHPESLLVVDAYASLLRPADEIAWPSVLALAENSDAAVHTRVRAHNVLALRAWLDGRPYRAVELAQRAEALGPGAAIDTAVLFFVQAAGAILKPDFDSGRRVLGAQTSRGRDPQVARLLWATQLIYRGEIAAARLVIAPLVRRDGRKREALLAPLAACIDSIASSMIDDPVRARDSLYLARGIEQRSPLISGATDHLSAIAATQLRPDPAHDDGMLHYASAARTAHSLGFRLLELFATYRLAHESEAAQRPELWSWLGRQLDGAEPVEGVPALLAGMGRTLGERNLSAAIALVTRLMNADLIHDAKVLSMSLLADSARSLSANARRQVARLAGHRFTRPAEGTPPGTPAETVLTDAERDVARFVVAGLSDREIGELTGRSRRTVSTHVGRILGKLGLPNRRHLTAELAKHHGVDLEDPGSFD
ncbi:helix-turn-helix transcriptional regulator [Zhihengliuella halotolerans]|uniref:helix-turn-helix transcriptional regulator n=1 Tax=Zhihengliuella halotolerans TaxID=370736 RepID=UPI000C7FAE87|nr:LuxR C-terminal-related transcriptional regulator [Zhihengliuella halotolerans]